jgi:hypothetical protein
MHTTQSIVASIAAISLSSSVAFAATTTHFQERGTTANLQVSSSLEGGCVNVNLILSATTSVTRPDGGTSGGAFAMLFWDDQCNQTSEFGIAFFPLTTELQLGSGNHTASLNVSLPLEMTDLFGVPTVTRTVTASFQLTSTADTVSGTSHARIGGSGFMLVQNASSVFNFADVAGQASIDGAPLLPQGFTQGSIETSKVGNVSISR